MTSPDVPSGAAQQQAWRDHVLPPVEDLGSGLWSIPVPIPDNPLRYVLVYALEVGERLAIVDAGWNTDSAWEALRGGIEATGHTVADVEAVLVTHIHPDHYGLAGRVRQQSGAWIGLHPADAALIPGRYGSDIDSVVDQMRDLLELHGVPATALAELTHASFGIRDWVDAVMPDRDLNDGDRVVLGGSTLRVIHTPGHSPGHVCFYIEDRRLLLSGDHILPRISPSIAIHSQQPGNPLADFLDSLVRLRGLSAHHVLPAHEWRFTGLEHRIDGLIAHHGRRLDELAALAASEPGLTTWELATRLTWSRPWDEISGFMRRAAVGETLAHLVLLASRGRVTSEAGAPVRWLPGISFP